MSYILDALRRSEAERASARAPTVTAVVEADQRPPRQRWLWWLLPANAAFVGIVLWSVTVDRPAPQSSDPPRSIQPPAARAEPGPAPQRLLQTRPDATARATLPEQALAEPLRSRIARLSFSTHIYADDRAMRSVSIDGQRLREGQSSDAGYRVAEITPDGVVLEIEGLRVAIDVMARWRL